jgi:hypothetical protein
MGELGEEEAFEVLPPDRQGRHEQEALVVDAFLEGREGPEGDGEVEPHDEVEEHGGYSIAIPRR